jgi:integrase
MATIESWKNGKYRARWRDNNGRTQGKVFDRQQDARQHLKNVGADLVRGDYIAPQLAASKFEVWADKWWKSTAKLSSNTRRGYHVLLTNHVLPHFGGTPMSRIDWAEVEEFLNEKLAEGHSAKRVRDMVSVVSLVMKTAIRSGARKDNPAKDHTIPQRRKKIRQGDILTMEQAQLLVSKTRDPYKPAVWLMVLLGLRPAELCGLRVGAVDFVRSVVHVTETLNAVHSFPGHTYGLEEGSPKTDAGDRRIPIPAWLRDDLATMLAVRAEASGRPQAPDDYLFLSVQGSKPIRVADLRRWVIRPALRAAGLPEELRTYDLRHSHASLLIDLGANPLEVAQRMGHTDPTVTLRVYGHLFDGAQERLTEKLDAHRAATPPPSTGEVVNLDDRRNRDTG